jgi:hypothetical protein
MLFRRRFLIPQLRFNDSANFFTAFALNDGRLSLEFSTIPPEEPAAAGSTHSSWADVTLYVREPKSEIAAMLDRVRANSLPEGEQMVNALIASKTGVPWDQQAHVMLESMPPQFLDYARSIERRFGDGVERFVGLLRWRYAQWGPPKAIKSALPLQWSDDNGKSWNYMPFTLHSTLRGDVTLAFDAARRDEIVALFEDGRELFEPVYRELLREANQLEDTSRRSSLILAVAAAEIAIKTLFQDLKSDFYGIDLLREAAPPATTMFADLTKLPLPATIHGQYLPPPSRLLEELQRAISARNGLAHVGAEPLDRDSLIVKMNAIRDLILIVDHYRGFTWTLDQLTQATKDDLAAMAYE